MLSALFDLKAKTLPLCDGSLTVKINGYARVETLKITVENKKPSVTPYDGECEITLSLTDAEVFFFRNHAANRAKINPYAASWLPLPLFIHEPDNV